MQSSALAAGPANVSRAALAMIRAAVGMARPRCWCLDVRSILCIARIAGNAAAVARQVR
jgi:hypothetical protein